MNTTNLWCDDFSIISLISGAFFLNSFWPTTILTFIKPNLSVIFRISELTRLWSIGFLFPINFPLNRGKNFFCKTIFKCVSVQLLLKLKWLIKHSSLSCFKWYFVCWSDTSYNSCCVKQVRPFFEMRQKSPLSNSCRLA